MLHSSPKDLTVLVIVLKLLGKKTNRLIHSIELKLQALPFLVFY